MIPIKIQCPCGQKYAFDIEPVDERMPLPVACPVCGADGTAAANQIIAQHLPAQAAPASGLRIPGRSAAPEQSPPLPPATPAAPAPRRPAGSGARNKWLIPAIAGAIVLVAAVVGLLFWQGHKTKGESPAPAQAAKDGLPHTLAELNQRYAEPPEGQNAATFFLKGFEALQIAPADRNSPNLPFFGKGQFPLPGGPLPPATKSAVASFIQRNQSALSFFEQGAKCEQSRYPIDLTQGDSTRLPHLTKLKGAAQMEVLVSLLKADAKQPAEAADAVLITLAAGRSLESEPLLISQLVRRACLILAGEGLERTLNQVALPPASLDRLKQAFDQAEAREASGTNFTCAVVGERVFGLAMFDLTPEQLQDFMKGATGLPTEQADAFKAFMANPDKNRKIEREFWEETFRQVLAARKEAFPARLKTGDICNSRVMEAKSKGLFFCNLMLPALGSKKEAGSLAHLRLSQTALALERFRAAHDNRYPDALGELSPQLLPAVPVDPFDGQSLRYRKQDSGYLLYSIGPDLKDDGGQRTPAGKGDSTSGKGDLVFEVIKPPKATPASASQS